MLGPYRVLRVLGHGASGQVLEAEEPEAGRRVAIKLLTAGQRANQAQLERFRRERQALARIDHPHVLRVHSAGRWQGTPYVVTELLSGRTLRERLQEGLLAPEEAVRLALEVGRGVGALHAAGLVHRDLKPENVLLDAGEHARVADLGLVVGEEDRSLTRTGALLGTPEYMAPEGFRGERLRDPQVDVYALGLILFELLTGRLPHGASSLPALMRERVERPQVDPRSLAPGVPGPLAAVCLRALSGSPAERHPDGQAFVRALEEACRLGSPRTRSPHAVASALLGVVALALAWALDRAGLRAGAGLERGAILPVVPGGVEAESSPALTWSPRVAAGMLGEPGLRDPASEHARGLALLETGDGAGAALALWSAARGPERDPEAAISLVRLVGRGARGLPADPAGARALLEALLLHERRLPRVRWECQWVWTGPGGLGKALRMLKARLQEDPSALHPFDGRDPALAVLASVARYEGWGSTAPPGAGVPTQPAAPVLQEWDAHLAHPDPDRRWLAAHWLHHAGVVGDEDAARLCPRPGSFLERVDALDPRDLLGFDGSRALSAPREFSRWLTSKSLHDAAVSLGETRERYLRFRELAGARLPGSAFELGQTLWNGVGVDPDRAAAQRWYALAALDPPDGLTPGLPWAWVWLGSALYAGWGGIQDREEALRCLRTGRERLARLGGPQLELHRSDQAAADALLGLSALEAAEGAPSRAAAWSHLQQLSAQAGPAERRAIATVFSHAGQGGDAWADFVLGHHERELPALAAGTHDLLRARAAAAGLTPARLGIGGAPR